MSRITVKPVRAVNEDKPLTRHERPLSKQETQVVALFERHPNKLVTVTDLLLAMGSRCSEPKIHVRTVLSHIRRKRPDLEIDSVHNKGYVLRTSDIIRTD